MSVSIKVAIRCRPFTCEDTLGVQLMQTAETSGEVILLNSKYSTNRFGFTWAWWSAHNGKKYAKGNDAAPAIEAMKFMGQQDVYESCGLQIKKDLLEGNAVVLFAYGLSGSGKTFTVFGPDDPATDVAWFKHSKPFEMWGIFPYLAYEVFQEMKDGWKISMKYFQNVVSIVRDLQSPVCEEKSYKAGMRKDKDGFMDVTWCTAIPLASWDELRENFQTANARKAISPTQFNHQSTRGHCIMTLEVEMPHPTMEGMKQKGRVYVCDLAGTEPAGDIVFAKYQHIKEDDGTMFHKYIGPHDDPKKTKELQDQGKKINLSLTEMAQFFMKMAQAIKKKKLKPGKSIPGCNSYFLCKYLKDTMLQARTYLFCAIRPEVKFHPYTFSTLGFAKNASVIKLSPKKATAASSPMERKLMKELEDMKKLVSSLQGGGGGGGGGGDPAMAAKMAEMSKMLEDKQHALQEALSSQGATGESAKNNASLLDQQKEEYERRGITMTEITPESEIKVPYLINLAEDEFRNKRFAFQITKPEGMQVGPGCDIQPMSFNVTKNHCKITKDSYTTGPQGDGFVNGKKIKQGASVPLKAWDRVVFGNDLYMFMIPGAPKPPLKDGETDKTTADFAATEFRAALRNNQTSAEQAAFAKQMAQFEAEKKKFEAERKKNGKGGPVAKLDAQKMQSARMAVKQELMEIVPKLKDIAKMFVQLDRGYLKCEATMLNTLAADTEGVPIVKVKVANVSAGERIILDPFEFNKVYQVMRDEIAFLTGAITSGNKYTIKKGHDPVTLLFDHDFQLGTAIFFIEYLIYYFPSEDADIHQDISNVVAPHNKVGALTLEWIPLAPGDEDGDNEAPDDELPEIQDPNELIGKPWTYKLKISGAKDLDQMAEQCYCQYRFLETTFTTENVESNSSNPAFEYECVHHVDQVTKEFLKFLQQPFHVSVFIKPYISNPPSDSLNTENPVIIGALSPDGAAAANADPMTRLKVENARLKSQNAQLRQENAELKKMLSSGSKAKGKIPAAKKLDQKVNGGEAKKAPAKKAPAKKAPAKKAPAKKAGGVAL